MNSTAHIVADCLELQNGWVLDYPLEWVQDNPRVFEFVLNQNMSIARNAVLLIKTVIYMSATEHKR